MNILISSSEGVRQYKNPEYTHFRVNNPVFLDWVTNIEIWDFPNTGGEYVPYYTIRFIGDHFHIDWHYETKLIRDDRYKEILEYFKKELNAKII